MKQQSNQQDSGLPSGTVEMRLFESLLDEGFVSVFPLDEGLDRYLNGDADAVEREIVELDASLTPDRQRSLIELREFVSEMQSYPWSRLNERLLQVNPVPDPFRFAREWLNGLTLRITTLIEPIRLRPMILDHTTSESPEAMLRQQLQFRDNLAIGSFTASHDTFHLHIEHNEWLAGTLASVVIVNPDDTVILERFVVFKEDFKPSVDMDAPRHSSEPFTITLIEINGLGLTGQAITSVLTDCRAAVQADPLAVDAWRSWAEGILLTVPDHSVANGILRDLEESIRSE